MSAQLTQTPPPNATPSRTPFPVVGVIREDLEQLRASWCWFVTLGSFLMLLGIGALTYTGMVWATVATALVFGCFMVAAGVLYIVGAFFTRGWGGFFLSLLAGVLHLAVGAIILHRPVEALLVYTLLLAVFFFVEGLFQIVGALAGRFQHWGWMLFHGIVTLVLGVMIWRQWPLSGLYVVGLFLGINLVVSGASYISLGLTARKLPV
jgi:uncharacterized membrane protein HdeD (DUF308 family)